MNTIDSKTNPFIKYQKIESLDGLLSGHYSIREHCSVEVLGAAKIIQYHTETPELSSTYTENTYPVDFNDFPAKQIGFKGKAPVWGYLLDIALDKKAFASRDGLVVEIDIAIHSGNIGLAITDETYASFISSEVILSEHVNTYSIRLEAPNIEACTAIIIRNTHQKKQSDLTSFTIKDIRLFSAIPAEINECLNIKMKRNLEIDWLAFLLQAAQSPFAPHQFTPNATSAKISIIDTDSLHTIFKGMKKFETPSLNKITSYCDWKMEINDAPILAHLYQHYKPAHHLEFGTWLGFGAKLCAKNSNANIWTLNLPDGEVNDAGEYIYTGASDAGDNIGKLYEEAGFGDRVTQILCDSTKWDSSELPDEFFDTILIDGGHAREVVEADTKQAIRLLKSKGLCIWHDFCPDPDIILSSQATRGVIEAICENYPMLIEHFENLVWIRKSYILFGIKK